MDLSQPHKYFLVVDAWVVATASQHSLDDRTLKAIDILCKILYVCHKIVLDHKKPDEDNIIDEYERQATCDFTRRWLITMQTRQDKIVFRSRAPVRFPILTDPDDEKYLQVAMNSPHKIVISQDSDLTSIADHAEVTGKGISIWGLEQAIIALGL